MDEQRLIELMKAAPQPEPADNFEAQVMARVEALGASRWFRIKDFMIRPRQLSFDPVRTLREGATVDTVLLYFLLASFAHLVLALILVSRLSGVMLPDTAWLAAQPWLAFLLSLWLAACGLVAHTAKAWGLRAAKWGVFCYIEAIVINSVFPLFSFANALFLLPLVLLALGEVLVGWYLALTLHLEMKRVPWKDS